MSEDVMPELPEKAVVVATVCVVSWLDDGGDSRYAIRTTGNAPLSTHIGLLELAKLDLYGDADVDPREEP